MTCSILSAIIAAVAAMKYIRNSRLESEAKARRSGEGKRAARVSEFNCLGCLDGVDVNRDCSRIRAGLVMAPPRECRYFTNRPSGLTAARAGAQIASPLGRLVSRISRSPGAGI